MTQLLIDVVDISGGTHPDDKVRLWAPQHRPDGERVVSTSPVDVPLVDGQATVEVLPGPARVLIMTQGVVDSAPKRVTIPDEQSVTLRAVIEDGLEWEPEVISRVATLASRAESAADRAENVVDTVHWQDDRLSVMGVLGPSLRGPKGDPGDPGDGTGGGAGDVLWSELNPVLDGKAPVSHDHTIGQVTGLQDELDAKAAVGHQHSWGDVTGKPETYPAESHSHPQSEVEGLEAALDGKAGIDHTHSQYAESSRVTALEDSQPIVVSSLPSSPLPGRIYLVTG